MEGGDLLRTCFWTPLPEKQPKTRTMRVCERENAFSRKVFVPWCSRHLLEWIQSSSINTRERRHAGFNIGRVHAIRLPTPGVSSSWVDTSVNAQAIRDRKEYRMVFVLSLKHRMGSGSPFCGPFGPEPAFRTRSKERACCSLEPHEIVTVLKHSPPRPQ